MITNLLFSQLTAIGKRLAMVLTMLLMLGIGQAWGADTWTWTANNGDFGSETPGTETGTVTLNEKSWSYSRDQAGHLGWGNSSIQFGSKNNPENVTLSTSAFSSYTITNISVKASSYGGAHTLTIKVGGETVKSATSLPSPSDSPEAISTGTISKKGDIRLEFSDKLRALYIQSITVTYEEAVTVSVTGVSLNKSTLTLTEGDSETLTATVAPANATDKTVTWTTNNSSVATVSSGKVTAVAEGSATITVTTNNGNKTATCNVIVNPKPKYTVTWDVNGDQSVTTQVTEGSKPTFPATPSSCDATSTTFYGWATATWDGKIDDINGKTIYTSANDMPAVNGAVTYYAVFATPEEGGKKSIIFSNQWNTNQELSIHKYFDNAITLSFAKNEGTTAPQYYTSSAAIRLYYGNTMTVTTTAPMQSITFTFVTEDAKGNSISTNPNFGTLSKTPTNQSSESLTHTWNVNTTEVTFTIGTNSNDDESGHCKISQIDVVIGDGNPVTYSDYTTSCGQTYTITLNTNGGTINAGNVTSYTYGVGATLPTNVTKENHQFGGWFDNSGCTGTAVTAISTTATGNKEYWAKWTELPKYTVTWSVVGNTTTEEVYSGKKPTGAPTIDPNDLPCEGADKFVGWTTGEYKGNSAPGTLYPTADDIPAITGETTFYAVFADYEQ